MRPWSCLSVHCPQGPCLSVHCPPGSCLSTVHQGYVCPLSTRAMSVFCPPGLCLSSVHQGHVYLSAVHQGHVCVYTVQVENLVSVALETVHSQLPTSAVVLEERPEHYLPVAQQSTVCPQPAVKLQQQTCGTCCQSCLRGWETCSCVSLAVSGLRYSELRKLLCITIPSSLGSHSSRQCQISLKTKINKSSMIKDAWILCMASPPKSEIVVTRAARYDLNIISAEWAKGSFSFLFFLQLKSNLFLCERILRCQALAEQGSIFMACDLPLL